MTRRRFGRVAALAALGLALAVPMARGESSRMGIQGDATIDPHFLFLDSNVSVNKHICSALTEMHPQTRVVPDLASSWKAVDDRTWEFEIRPEARFHDGTPVEAEDAVASVRRVRTLPNNPAPTRRICRPSSRSRRPSGCACASAPIAPTRCCRRRSPTS